MKLPEELRSAASETKKLIYIYLQRVRNASIDELSDKLGLRRLELYPSLSSLQDMGLVKREGSRFIVVD